MRTRAHHQTAVLFLQLKQGCEVNLCVIFLVLGHMTCVEEITHMKEKLVVLPLAFLA